MSGSYSTLQFDAVSSHVTVPGERVPKYALTVTGHCTRIVDIVFTQLFVFISALRVYHESPAFFNLNETYPQKEGEKRIRKKNV